MAETYLACYMKKSFSPPMTYCNRFGHRMLLVRFRTSSGRVGDGFGRFRTRSGRIRDEFGMRFGRGQDAFGTSSGRVRDAFRPRWANRSLKSISAASFVVVAAAAATKTKEAAKFEQKFAKNCCESRSGQFCRSSEGRVFLLSETEVVGKQEWWRLR